MSVHLRKTTQAIIPDNSIVAAKLADGAVVLSSDKVSGLLPNTKLAAIADVNKIEDNLITLAKCKDDVKLNNYVGGEEEQSVLGIVETDLAETSLVKVVGVFEPKKIRIISSLKLEGESGETAFLKIYIDEEEEARLTLQTTNRSDYELLSGEIDISDLPTGKHKIFAKGYTDSETAKCWMDLVDILVVK